MTDIAFLRDVSPLSDDMLLSIVEPSKARTLHPRFMLRNAVLRRIHSMGPAEIRSFASLCGVREEIAFDDDMRFCAQIEIVVARYSLERLFAPLTGNAAHRAWSPTGFSWEPRDWNPTGVSQETKCAGRVIGPELPRGIHTWRASYKELPAPARMIAATLIWLYRRERDYTWLGRVPQDWHAAYALAKLRDADALADWARLVALYQSW
ncbi:MAG: hypothetical protein IBJ15_05000 [Alphaproteobacteria bacterium]|nr:hypothetical protein [Alphaproteobacteria bacterium]